jgi:hypothetical protein
MKGGLPMSGENKGSIFQENKIFEDTLGTEVLVVTTADQLNFNRQTFLPIFLGTVSEVTNGFLRLDPVNVKMENGTFYRFPTPLCIPFKKISSFTPYDPDYEVIM